MRYVAFLFASLSLMLISIEFAHTHGDSPDKYGCHDDKVGGFHCHQDEYRISSLGCVAFWEE